MLPFLILIITYYMQLTVNNYKLGRKDQLRTQAQLGADAGIDYALQQVNSVSGWAGTATPTEIQNDGKVRVTYEVIATDNNADSKTLTAIGRSYSPTTHTTPDSAVKIKVDLRAVKSGYYSIVTGVGGLYLSNSAKIVGGDVLVNGEINLTNSSQIGLTTNPVNVQVAHQTCPNPANNTYPRLCSPNENGQPINIQNTAHIYGTVKANNQTNGAGMTNPGLTASSGVPAQPLPSHDRAGQVAAVATTVTSAAAGCSSGTKTWAANTKITGDVSISGTCQVTVNGNVWITGSLTVKNSAKLIVSNTLTTTQPTLMIDGNIASFSNSAELKSNSNSTGFEIVTYKSNASCSPTCSDVTGTDLYNSRNLVTISLDNNTSAPNTIFYARWSRVQINNAGLIGALIGQTIELKNSGTISFGTSVPGVGNTYWVIDGYRRSFN
jgi:hypothetical protein